MKGLTRQSTNRPLQWGSRRKSASGSTNSTGGGNRLEGGPAAPDTSLAATSATATGGVGWLAVVPPVLAIGLALLTRQVVVALVLGVWTGALILEGHPGTAFLRLGDRVVAQFRSQREPVEALAAEFGAETVQSVCADLTGETACRSLVRAAGLPQVLVHSAGIWNAGPIADLDAAALEEMFRCNAFSAYYLASEIARLLRRGDDDVPRASMVFIGSILYILGLILTDISYTWADPRVRLN